MQQNDKIYEYIGVYVDDNAAAAKDPNAITDLLQDKFFSLSLKVRAQSPSTLAAISSGKC